jgi:PST family polysaccharide transporter
LRRTAVSNLGLATLWKGLSWVVNWAVAIVLARVMPREDFGLFAIATVLTGLFARFSEMGIATAVVQRQRDDPATLETAFTLRLVALLAAGVLLAAAAPLWASFYGRALLAPVIWSVLLPTVASGLFFIPSVRLYRDYRHGRTRFAQFAGEAAKGAGVLVAALLGARVWSFVVGYVAGSLVSWACYVAFSPWKPRLRLDPEVAREILAFGKFVLVADLLTFAVGNVDKAIVGKLLGSEALGDYGQAYVYGSWAVAEVAQLLSETLYPAFALRRGDAVAQRKGWRATLRATGVVVFPLTLGLASVAPDFVRGVLNPAGEPGKWAGAIVPLRILCLFALVLSFERVSRPVVFSSGRPRAVTVGQGAMLLVQVAGLLLAVPAFGLPGAAGACVLAAAAATAVVVRAAARFAAVSAREILADLSGPFAAAAAMTGTVLLAGSVLGATLGPLGRLGAEVAVGVLAYVLAGRLLMPGIQREILGEVRLLLRPPAPR